MNGWGIFIMSIYWRVRKSMARIHLISTPWFCQKRLVKKSCNHLKKIKSLPSKAMAEKIFVEAMRRRIVISMMVLPRDYCGLLHHKQLTLPIMSLYFMKIVALEIQTGKNLLQSCKKYKRYLLNTGMGDKIQHTIQNAGKIAGILY